MPKDQTQGIEALIKELEKDPGKPAISLAKSLDGSQSGIGLLLRKLQKFKEPEIMKLLAKREAYLKGGSQIVEMIKKDPGISYYSMNRKLKADGQKLRITVAKPEELLKGLIGYCKKYKDKELREILVKYKKAGGWMP